MKIAIEFIQIEKSNKRDGSSTNEQKRSNLDQIKNGGTLKELLLEGIYMQVL